MVNLKEIVSNILNNLEDKHKVLIEQLIKINNNLELIEKHLRELPKELKVLATRI